MRRSVAVRARRGNVNRPKRRRSSHATLKECGKLFGVTKERIRQIEASALRKLRKAILDDPQLAQIVRELFGDKAVAEVRAAGFFEPEKPLQREGVSIDLPATIVDALRILGPSTGQQIRSATMLPSDDVQATLRGLIAANVVRVTFRNRTVVYTATEGRVVA